MLAYCVSGEDFRRLMDLELLSCTTSCATIALLGEADGNPD
jgi:hypothetical protein